MAMGDGSVERYCQRGLMSLVGVVWVVGGHGALRLSTEQGLGLGPLEIDLRKAGNLAGEKRRTKVADSLAYKSLQCPAPPELGPGPAWAQPAPGRHECL
jgi:hypothetical protein